MPLDFNKLAGASIDQSSEGKDANVQKYLAATRKAYSDLAGSGDSYTDLDLKKMIDKNYEDMGGQGTGNQIRSNGNPFNEAIAALKDWSDERDRNIGDFLDGTFDALGGTVGKATDAIGVTDDAENWAKNLFNGADAAMVGNAMTTGLTSAIPIIGPFLAAAKEGVQNSDNIYEAMTGQDSITGEQLDGVQRGERGLEALLNIGLAALPGASGAKAASAAAKTAGKKAAEQTAKEAGEEVVEQAAKVAGKETAAKSAEKAGEKTADEHLRAVGKNAFTKNTDEAAEATRKAEQTGDATDAKNAQQAKDKETDESGFLSKINDLRKRAVKDARERGVMRPEGQKMFRLAKDEDGKVRPFVSAGGDVARFLGNAAAMSGSVFAPTVMDDLRANGADGEIFKMLQGQGSDKLSEELARNAILSIIPGRKAVPRTLAAYGGATPRAANYLAPMKINTANSDEMARDEEEQISDQDLLRAIASMGGGR